MKGSIADIIGSGFTSDPLTSKAPAGQWYNSDAVHEAERQHVFARHWIFVAHETELAERGSFVVTEIAGESIVLLRSDDGIGAFYNVCQHRGHALLSGRGTLPNLVVCPYHSWSYQLNGQLRAAPKMRHVPDFCTDVSLTPVRLEVIGGFVFVNLDHEAPSFAEMAPAFEPALRSMVAECEQLQRSSVINVAIRADWKIVTENFLEAYHVEFSGTAHRKLAAVIDTETYRATINGLTIEYTAAGGAAESLPYNSNVEAEFTNAEGARFHQIFLYPNMTFSVFPDSNTLFIMEMGPDGAGRCAERFSYFTLGGEMSAASRTAEDYISRQLNVEDIALVEAVQRGTSSKGYQPGRFMVDAARAASWSEHFVHHFNATHLAALQRG